MRKAQDLTAMMILRAKQQTPHSKTKHHHLKIASPVQKVLLHNLSIRDQVLQSSIPIGITIVEINNTKPTQFSKKLNKRPTQAVTTIHLV